MSPLPLTDPRPAPPNRTCRVSLEGAYGDARWANVMWFYFTGSGTITTSDLNSFAASVFAAWQSGVHHLCSSDDVLQLCQANLYFNDDLFVGTHAGSAAGGDSTGADLPANVAIGISWNIASHYRGGHPRTYVGGWKASTAVTQTSVAGATVAALQSGANDFHDAVEALGPIGDGIATVEHGVVSFQSAKQWRTPPLFRRISGATVDNRFDTQRRRLGRDR